MSNQMTQKQMYEMFYKILNNVINEVNKTSPNKIIKHDGTDLVNKYFLVSTIKHDNTLDDYLLFATFDEQMKPINLLNTPIGQTVYYTIATNSIRDNKFHINLLRRKHSDPFSTDDFYEYVEMDPKLVLNTVKTPSYQKYINKYFNIPFDRIINILSYDFIIEYSPRHDYIHVKTNGSEQICLANINIIERDTNKSYRMFTNATDKDMFNKRITNAGTLSYQYNTNIANISRVLNGVLRCIKEPNYEPTNFKITYDSYRMVVMDKEYDLRINDDCLTLFTI